MRKLCLVLALGACSSSDDLHELETCDPVWSTALPSVALQRCERACAVPPMVTGPQCRTTSCASGDGRTCQQVPCTATFDADGQRGCCMLGGSSGALLMQFYACD